MYQSGPDPVPAANTMTTDEAAEGSAMTATARGFIGELVHAMQAAAEHQREATNTEVEAMTRAHLERVRVRAAAEAEELRRMAQADIDEINAWQEAEAVRVREEAARRIVVRGQELDDYLVRHAAIIDTEVDQIEGAVANYQLELDGFFGKLTSESDPGEIARMADELPPPPDLAKVGGEARAQALAAVAAEGDAATASADGVAVADDATRTADAAADATPADAGPNADRAPVPVMAPKNGAGAAADGGTSAGPDKTNPAIRILRSIATLATPAADGAKAINGSNGRDTASAEVAEKPVPVTTPVDDIAVPTEPAPHPVEAAKD